MMTFSFLSHSKKLPRATGTVDFDIERYTAAPSRRDGGGPSPNSCARPRTLLAVGAGLRERQAAASHPGYSSAAATLESGPWPPLFRCGVRGLAAGLL